MPMGCRCGVDVVDAAGARVYVHGTMQLPIELHFEFSPPCACIVCQSADVPAAANGIDAHQAEAAGSNPAHKVRLARANNEAIATRVFSAPVWGNQRWPQIGRWLAQAPF